MNRRLSLLLQEWALRDWDGDNEIFLNQSAVEYLGRKIYDDYEPAQFDKFEDRLDLWLHNMHENEDQQVLFRLLSHLFFVGRPEFESLCRAAYHGPISRWIVESLNIDIADPEAGLALNEGMKRSWFCPITDSMRINSFLKINQLTGRSHRPDWRSLRKFGDQNKVMQFIEANEIDRVVLLEDFVGTGTQMRSVIQFAARLSANLQVLVCPLVVCPDGNDMGNQMAREHPNITYVPVMQISAGMLIKADAQPDEPAYFATVRDLVYRVRTRLSNPEADVESQRYHGYKGTGAIVAMYSNCPNNSLPILYDATDQWDPLFPRIERR